MSQARLQFRHLNSVFESRAKAEAYLAQLVNGAYGTDKRLDEELIGEPIVIVYLDEDGNKQVILAIGTEGERGEGVMDVQYHYIDSAKIEEEITEMSGSSADIREELRQEILRATTAENTISGMVITETERAEGVEGALDNKIDELSAGTVSEVERLDGKIDYEYSGRTNVTGQKGFQYVKYTLEDGAKYITSATSLNEADFILDKKVQDLENDSIKNVIVNKNFERVLTGGVSSAIGVVVDNISELKLTTNNIGFDSDYEGDLAHHGHSLTYFALKVEEALRKTSADIEAAIDALDYTDTEEAGKILAKVDETNGVISVTRRFVNADDVKIVSTTPTSTEYASAYKLINGNNEQLGLEINIPKDQLIKDVKLSDMNAQLDDNGMIVDGSPKGDTALVFSFAKADGTYKIVKINIEHFIEENEFMDGFRTENHKVYVKIDANSESFLTVSPDGVKLDGVQNAIDNAVNAEETRATNIENALQAELDATQGGAGLNADGTYKSHDSQYTYINPATSLDDADMRLDKGLRDLDDKIDQEITDRTQDVATLTQSINDEASAREQADTDLRTDLNTETQDRSDADDALQLAIDAEAQTREDRDNDIEGDLQTEIQNRSDADDFLALQAGLNSDHTYHKHNTASDMGNYISGATSIDDATMKLDIALKAEETARLNGQSDITDELAQLEGAIEAEENRATQEEGILAQAIADEESRATQEETTIATNLATEIGDRTDSDNAIIAGAGLNADGTYHPHNTFGDMGNYIMDATSIDEATMKLDEALKQTDTKVASLEGRENVLEQSIADEQTRAEGEEARIEGKVDTEQARAEQAEQNLSNDIVSEANFRINADNTLTNDLNSEINRAGQAENVLQGNINDEISRATGVEQTLEQRITRNCVKSTGNTIVVSPATEGTNIEVNIDESTIVKLANGTLKSGIKLLELPASSLPEEILCAYKLADANGNYLSDSAQISIPKVSELINVTIDERGGDTYLIFTYRLSGGNTQIVECNVSELIIESEFKDGLRVDGHKVYVNIDQASESFLTVSSEGVKLSGVQDAINAAAAGSSTVVTGDGLTHIAIAKTVETDGHAVYTFTESNIANADALSAEITRAQGAELANSNAITAEVNRATNRENQLQSALNEEVTNRNAAIATETARAQLAEQGLQSAINEEVANRDAAISVETARAQTAEGNISAQLVSEVSARNAAIAEEKERAELAEQGLENDIYNESVARDAAISVETSRASAAETTLDSKITAEKTRAEAAETNLTNNLANEVTRATGVEDDLAEDIADEVTRATTAENALDSRISDIESLSIAGQQAIKVNGNPNQVVSLAINANDKVLTQDDAGLVANISANYDSTDQKIYLKGANDVVISTIDCADFIKDGMIESVVFSAATKELIIKWNTSAGKETTVIDLTSLVAVYTVKSDSTNYLSINDFEVGAKVGVEHGLAPYDDFAAVSAKTATLNDDLYDTIDNRNSIKHVIMTDSMIASEVTTAPTTEQSLIRVIPTSNKFYVSNDTKDMVFDGANLQTVLSGLTASTSGSSAEIVVLSGQVVTLTEKVETLETKVQALEDYINNTLETTIKNTVASIINGTTRAIKVDKTDVNNITIGFADDAIFGPISLS